MKGKTTTSPLEDFEMSEFTRSPMSVLMFYLSGLEVRPSKIGEDHVKWYIGKMLAAEPCPDTINKKMHDLWSTLLSAKDLGWSDQGAVKASRFSLPSGAWDTNADAFEVLAHIPSAPVAYLPETVGETVDGIELRKIRNIGLRWSRGFTEALFGEPLRPEEVVPFLLR